jgi:hypothetical protein
MRAGALSSSSDRERQGHAMKATGAVLTDVTALIRAQIALVKAEVEQSIRTKLAGVGLSMGAGVLAWLGVQGLLIAVALGLAVVLPVWAAALIVSGVLLAFGAGCGLLGKRQLSATLNLNATKQHIHEDVAWVKSCLTPIRQPASPLSPTPDDLSGHVAASNARTKVVSFLKGLAMEGTPMSTRMETGAWKAVGAGGAVVVGLVARKLLTVTWTKARKTSPRSVSAVQSAVQEGAATLVTKGSQLAAQAQTTGSEVAAQAQRKGAELADRGLRHLGERLAQGRLAQPLGIQASKRRLPVWLAALLGVGGGYAMAVLAGSTAGVELRERLVRWVGSRTSPRVEAVRSMLDHDPRTARLSDLDVTVAGRSVSVHGTIPPDVDQEALRQVIAQVPGVQDVDLQVAVSA